jgi:hypothetical protein
MFTSAKTLLLLVTGLLFQPNTNAELEKKEVLQKKIQVLVPKNWKALPVTLIKTKYPGAQPPQEVYTDSSGQLSLAFNHTDSKLLSSQLHTYANVLKASLNKANPQATWLQSGFIHVEGKEIGFFKLVSNVNGQKIFNQVYFTELKGRLLLGTFNCTESKLESWKLFADKFMYSLHLN